MNKFRIYGIRTFLILGIISAPPFCLEAAVGVKIGQNFTGSTLFVDSSACPPDSNGAAGPQHFVEFINGRFSVYAKTDGTRVQTMTDREFWMAAGVNIGNLTLSKPRIVYDRLTSRWFASQIDVDFNHQLTNRFLVAVSESGDPGGAWHGIAFVADKDGRFADFPTLGLDANGVYLCANMYDNQKNFLGVKLTSIPKADLLQAIPSAENRSVTSIHPESEYGFALQPLIDFSQTNEIETLIAASSSGLDQQLHSSLKSLSVSNASAAFATIRTNADLAVPGFSVPYNPPQPDGSDLLDDGDSRIGASIYQVGDYAYAVHGLELDNRAALRWYKISVPGNAVVQSGTITDPDLELFYPSIAANENGFVVIGFNACSFNSFIGSYAVAGETIGGKVYFGGKVLLEPGADNYEQLGPEGVSRWGGYSATTADPSRPDRFWTIQEYVRSKNVWSTRITEMILSALPPSLSIRVSGDSIQLAWQTADDGYSLESTSDLSNTIGWSPITNTVVAMNGSNIVTFPITQSQQYFRLKK